jgi:hypothetical protein
MSILLPLALSLIKVGARRMICWYWMIQKDLMMGLNQKKVLASM